MFNNKHDIQSLGEALQGGLWPIKGSEWPSEQFSKLQEVTHQPLWVAFWVSERQHATFEASLRVRKLLGVVFRRFPKLGSCPKIFPGVILSPQRGHRRWCAAPLTFKKPPRCDWNEVPVMSGRSAGEGIKKFSIFSGANPQMPNLQIKRHHLLGLISIDQCWNKLIMSQRHK